MGTTTKKDLTNAVAVKLKMRQVLVRDIIQGFLDACVDELARGNRIEFRDFGVFEAVHRKGRKARNPRTNETVQVPPKTVVDFRMGKKMQDAVNPGNQDGPAPVAPAP